MMDQHTIRFLAFMGLFVFVIWVLPYLTRP
jgi:hypothetical protein